jgi:putative hydrolase of the HAD superfamily
MIDASIRAVFFDAVGTLIFPRVPIHQTYADIASRHGVHVEADRIRAGFRDAFARQEKIDQTQSWRTDEGREILRWRTIVCELISGPKGVACFADLWLYFSLPATWTIHPETSEFLSRLSGKGLTLGIASNFDARLVGIVNALPELAPLRDRCAISSLIGWRKPAAEFFRAVVATTDYNANEVLYVGDDFRNDIEGATAAGLRAILFDPQATTSDSRRIRRLRDLLPG